MKNNRLYFQTWPNDTFVRNLLRFEQELEKSSRRYKSRSTFEGIRKITSDVRPPGTHGCKLTEVIPGLPNLVALLLVLFLIFNFFHINHC